MSNVRNFKWFVALEKINTQESNIVTNRRVIRAISKFGAYRQAILLIDISNKRGANLKLIKVIDAPHLN